jgi:NADH-quinone oxidoreductase subunit L
VFLNKVLFVLLLIAAGLTAIYMTRLVVLTFFGKPRWRDEATGEAWVSSDQPLPNRHPHESPWHMTVPLLALAGLAFAGGFINMPFSWGSKEDGTKGDTKYLEHWLEPSLRWDEYHLQNTSGGMKFVLAIVATIMAAGAIAWAWKQWSDERGGTGPDAPEILSRGWRYDETVSNFMGGPGRKGFEAITSFDRTAIDGVVNKVGDLVRLDGNILRRLQNGLVRSYAVLIGVGAIALMAYFLITGNA